MISGSLYPPRQIRIQSVLCGWDWNTDHKSIWRWIQRWWFSWSLFSSLGYRNDLRYLEKQIADREVFGAFTCCSFAGILCHDVCIKLHCRNVCHCKQKAVITQNWLQISVQSECKFDDRLLQISTVCYAAVCRKGSWYLSAAYIAMPETTCSDD